MHKIKYQTSERVFGSFRCCMLCKNAFFLGGGGEDLQISTAFLSGFLLLKKSMVGIYWRYIAIAYV